MAPEGRPQPSSVSFLAMEGGWAGGPRQWESEWDYEVQASQKAIGSPAGGKGSGQGGRRTSAKPCPKSALCLGWSSSLGGDMGMVWRRTDVQIGHPGGHAPSLWASVSPSVQEGSRRVGLFQKDPKWKNLVLWMLLGFCLKLHEAHGHRLPGSW